MGEPTESGALAPLESSDVALLTSFKRDGTGIGTPVAVGVHGDRAYFTTRSKSWKVKRIARNSEVTLAPSDPMGTVTGETVRGTARRLPEADVKAMRKGIEYHVWRFIYQAAYADEPVTYEVTAAS
jgi:PPOX class probable F420-dependent enzyme